MVQIIKGGTEQRQAQERLGYTMGKSLSESLLNFGASKAIDSVVNDPELKDAPMPEKLGKLEEALRPYGDPGKKMLMNRMAIAQQEQQQKEQEVLGKISSGQKVSPKEFSALSPNTQMSVMKYAQAQEAANKKINLDTLASSSFSKGYKAILDNDLKSLKEVISDPNTPLNVKTQLGSIQSTHSQRADIKSRDVNRRVNDVQGAYARAIAAERNRLGKPGGYRKDEVAAINQKITELEKSRKQDMQKLLKNPESYGSLSIWGNPEMIDYLPGEENRGNAFEEGEEPEGEAAKFDASNPEHRSEAENLFKQYGNKEKVRSLLREKYTGI